MVEIKELVVRTIIAGSAPDAGSPGSNGTGNMNGQEPLTESPSNAIVEDCVRQVLAILERQKER